MLLHVPLNMGAVQLAPPFVNVHKVMKEKRVHNTVMRVGVEFLTHAMVNLGITGTIWHVRCHVLQVVICQVDAKQHGAPGHEHASVKAECANDVIRRHNSTTQEILDTDFLRERRRSKGGIVLFLRITRQIGLVIER